MAVDVRSQFEEEPSAIRPDRVKRSPRLRAAFGRLAPLAVFIALLAALGSFAPSFLSLYSLRVLAGESSAILLLAIGQTLVILLGGIDLSMGAL
jgi:ribose transport system permease protein